MNASERLHISMVKVAHPAVGRSAPGLLGAASVLLPWLPISTAQRLHAGQGGRGAGTGVVEDMSRGVGSLGGAALAQNWAGGVSNKWVRLLALLGGSVTGGMAGHALGKNVGEAAFKPKNPGFFN